MVTFNFTLKSKTKPVVNKVSSITVDGIVVMINNIYKIKVGDKLYDIDINSITTKGQRIIYARWLDKNGHRIKIIRNEEDRSDIGIKFYTNIAVGLKVKANVVNNICSIIKVYHDTSIKDIEIDTIKNMFFEYDE